MATAPKVKTPEQVSAELPAVETNVAPSAPGASQAVATIGQGGEVATLDAIADTFEGFENSGMEQVTARDILIPRLTILQKLSPQLNRKNVLYLGDQAKEGMICDVGLGELLPTPLHVIPCVWTKTWIEWAPRQTGKGIVGYHDESIMARTTPNERGQPTFNGNLIAETAQWYVLNLTTGGRPSFIAMTSTQIRRSRRWMTWAQGERVRNSAGREFVPPLFYRSYYLTDPVEETKGENSWYSWMIERGPALHEFPDFKNMLQRCVEFSKSITKDQMRADLAAAVTDPTQGEGETIDERGNRADGEARM